MQKLNYKEIKIHLYYRMRLYAMIVIYNKYTNDEHMKEKANKIDN